MAGSHSRNDSLFSAPAEEDSIISVSLQEWLRCHGANVGRLVAWKLLGAKLQPQLAT
jgi:hypothetical protein